MVVLWGGAVSYERGAPVVGMHRVIWWVLATSHTKTVTEKTPKPQEGAGGWVGGWLGNWWVGWSVGRFLVGRQVGKQAGRRVGRKGDGWIPTRRSREDYAFCASTAVLDIGPGM